MSRNNEKPEAAPPSGAKDGVSQSNNPNES